MIRYQFLRDKNLILEFLCAFSVVWRYVQIDRKKTDICVKVNRIV